MHHVQVSWIVAITFSLFAVAGLSIVLVELSERSARSRRRASLARGGCAPPLLPEVCGGCGFHGGAHDPFCSIRPSNIWTRACESCDLFGGEHLPNCEIHDAVVIHADQWMPGCPKCGQFDGMHLETCPTRSWKVVRR